MAVVIFEWALRGAEAPLFHVMAGGGGPRSRQKQHQGQRTGVSSEANLSWYSRDPSLRLKCGCARDDAEAVVETPCWADAGRKRARGPSTAREIACAISLFAQDDIPRAHACSR